MTNTPIDEFRSRIVAGDLSVVEDLKASGLDLNDDLIHGQTPLMLAASAGHSDLVIALIDCGASVHATGHQGLVPLHEAAAEGHVAVILTLLKAGALVDATTIHGTTPLMCAAAWGFIEAARLLIDHGADIARTDNRGGNAYDVAGEKCQDAMAELLKDEARRRGCDIG